MRKTQKKNTFAKPTTFGEVTDIVEGGSGGGLSVIVSWNERVLDSYSFNKQGTIYYGSTLQKNCVSIRGVEKSQRLALFSSTQAQIYVPSNHFDYYVKGVKTPFSELSHRGQVQKTQQGVVLTLKQGELVRFALEGGVVLCITFSPTSRPAPLGAILDLSVSELSAVMLSLALTAVWALFVYFFTDQTQLSKVDENIERVNVVFQKTAESDSRQSSRGQVRQKKTKKRTIIRVATKGSRKNDVSGLLAKKTRVKRTQVGQKARGVKVRKKIDPKKVGLLSVLASGGKQQNTGKSPQGDGGIYGLANRSQKNRGQNLTGTGSSFGASLKGNLSAGGSPKGVVKGVSDIGSYRSSLSQRGSDTILGTKEGVEITYGSTDEEFIVGASISLEDIKRVIQANRHVIKFCYETAQDLYPQLEGELMLTWLINSRGRASKVQVLLAQPGRIRGVGLCVAKNIRRWKFPRALKGELVRVKIPFSLRRKGL